MTMNKHSIIYESLFKLHYDTQNNKGILRLTALIQHPPFHSLPGMIKDSDVGKC